MPFLFAGPGVGFVIQNADQLQSSVKKATADGAAKTSAITHSAVTSGGGSYSTSAASNAISAPTYSSQSLSVISSLGGHKQVVSSGGVGTGVHTKSTSSGKRRKMVVRKKKRKNVPALPITSKKAGHRGYGHY